jgi:hypothetical protein
MRPNPIPFGALVVGLAAATGLVALAGPAGATTSAQATYNAALKAAGRQGVHFESNATEDGTSIKVIGDTGTTSGAQTVLVSKGKKSESLAVMLVGVTGYVKGNATALENILGLSSTDSGTYGGKWLSFPVSNTELAQLVSGLHQTYVPTELALSGPLSFGTSASVNGQRATAIKGTIGSTAATQVPAVLYVASSGTPLPVEEVTNPSRHGGKSAINGTVTFTHWGEKTHEKAPAHSTSLLSLDTSVAG